MTVIDLATTGNNDSYSGPRITLGTFQKNPGVVRQRIIQMFDQQWLPDALLRTGPDATSGAVQFWDSNNPFFANDAPDVAEYAEIPVVQGDMGLPKFARSRDKAFSIVLSDKDARRNDRGKFDLQMTQARNTMVRTWENLFLGTVRTALPTMAASAVWSTVTTRIGDDLAEGQFAIQNADADTTDGTGKQKLGFNPDTLVLSTRTAADFLKNDTIAKMFEAGPMASDNLKYKLKLPRKFWNFDIVTSWQLPVTEALLLERGTVGFISDEDPFKVTPGYRVPERRLTRWDLSRVSLIGIDNPKAGLRITGVHS